MLHSPRMLLLTAAAALLAAASGFAGDAPLKVFILAGQSNMEGQGVVSNLVNLVKDIRSEFKSPDLPGVIGELGNGGPAKPGSGMETFRKAQKEGAKKISHARFVPTAQFARDKDLSPNTGHGHHWFGNAESYFLVGDALGGAMVGLLD